MRQVTKTLPIAFFIFSLLSLFGFRRRVHSVFCYASVHCHVLSALPILFYRYLHSFWFHLSRDIVVGVATCLGTGGWTVRDASPDWVKRFLSSPNRPYRLWGPLSFLLSGHRRYFPAVKRPRQDVDRPPPSNVVVKNKWSYISTPSTCFHGIDRENCCFLTFSFSFTIKAFFYL